jgi:tetratricopeptide (TPR) repeat protein
MRAFLALGICLGIAAGTARGDDPLAGFLQSAESKYNSGNFNQARDICEELLKREPANESARRLNERAKRSLAALAEDAYDYGILFESLNRIEEAKSYWNRAMQYVRPGDPLYDRVKAKLDRYL